VTSTSGENQTDRPLRWAGVSILAILTWHYARLPIDGSGEAGFLHLPNLVFHEAGHWILMPLGRFMSVLGGSLMQALIPVVCSIAFLRQGNRYGAAVCMWWAGQNLIDLAPYIADARRLQLILLGGFTGAEVEGHDWEYILSTLGWLQYDLALGRTAQAAGALVMAGATIWAALLLLPARTSDVRRL
jgi:hypothetical protein